MPGSPPPAKLPDRLASYSAPEVQLHTTRPSSSLQGRPDVAPLSTLQPERILEALPPRPLTLQGRKQEVRAHAPCPRSLHPEALQPLAAGSHKLNANQVVSAPYLSMPTLPLVVPRTTKDPAGEIGGTQACQSRQNPANLNSPGTRGLAGFLKGVKESQGWKRKEKPPRPRRGVCVRGGKEISVRPQPRKRVPLPSGCPRGPQGMPARPPRSGRPGLAILAGLTGCAAPATRRRCRRRGSSRRACRS